MSLLGILGGIKAGVDTASSVAGLASAIFQPSLKKKIKMQEESNIRMMNEQYGLNEQAADNAQQRQWETYEKYQSPEAMRQQYEDAGLSVGLMYGGAGGGQMGSAVMGGGAGTQQGADVAAMQQAAIQQKELGLRFAKLGAEIDLIKAQAENLRSGSKKNLADVDYTNMMTERGYQLLEHEVERIVEENKNIPILRENMIKEGELTDAQIDEIGTTIQKILSEIEINEATVKDIFKGIDVKDAQIIMYRTQAKLNNQQARESVARITQEWTRIQNETTDTETRRMQMEINEAMAAFERGEKFEMEKFDATTRRMIATTQQFVAEWQKINGIWKNANESAFVLANIIHMFTQKKNNGMDLGTVAKLIQIATMIK